MDVSLQEDGFCSEACRSQKYKVRNGTYYSHEASEQVIQVLEAVRASQTRIKLEYGDLKQGLVWDGCERGTIGRSMGPIHIPLLRKTARSLGGQALLESCIIRISESRSGKVLYEKKP
jgi:hypothetical protein